MDIYVDTWRSKNHIGLLYTSVGKEQDNRKLAEERREGRGKEKDWYVVPMSTFLGPQVAFAFADHVKPGRVVSQASL